MCVWEWEGVLEVKCPIFLQIPHQKLHNILKKSLNETEYAINLIQDVWRCSSKGRSSGERIVDDVTAGLPQMHNSVENVTMLLFLVIFFQNSNCIQIW